MNETALLFLLGLLATGLLSCFGFSWRLHVSMAKRLETEVNGIQGRITRELQRLQQEFYEYKLHVANDFATLRHLRESEERTHRSLTDISAKLDRLIEGRMSK